MPKKIEIEELDNAECIKAGLPPCFYGTPPSGRYIHTLLAELLASQYGYEIESLVFSGDLQK